MLRLTWSRTFPNVSHDFCASDKDTHIGRIYRITGGPKDGQWFFVVNGFIAGAWQNIHGHEPSKDEAARALERAYFGLVERSK